MPSRRHRHRRQGFFRPLDRRQTLYVRLVLLLFIAILSFPPWYTCHAFEGGTCSWAAPYGWGFALNILSSGSRTVSFLFLFLEVALGAVLGGYLLAQPHPGRSANPATRSARAAANRASLIPTAVIAGVVTIMLAGYAAVWLTRVVMPEFANLLHALRR